MKKKIMKSATVWAILLAMLFNTTIVYAEENTNTVAEGSVAEEQAEEPKVEEPEVEEQAEEPEVEEPKVEEPKTEETTEEPEAEQPKTEEPKIEEPKVEEPKVEEPKAEEPEDNTPTEDNSTEEKVMYTICIIDTYYDTDGVSLLKFVPRITEELPEGTQYEYANSGMEGYRVEGEKIYKGTITEDTTLYFKYVMLGEEIQIENKGSIKKAPSLPVVQADKYTVTFDFDDGETVDTQEVNSGDKMNVPKTPQREGYEFLYWINTADDSMWYGYMFENAVYEDLNFKAVWDQIYYVVKFDTGGGTKVDNRLIRCDYHETMRKIEAVAPAPKKEGFRLTGWTYKGNPWDIKNGIVSEDMVLVAQWEAFDKATDTYTITFDTTGGSAVTSQQIKHGEKIKEPTAPTKEGYVFSCWMYITDKTNDSSGASQWNFNNNTVTEDIELYAVWDDAISIIFNTDGGTAVETQVLKKWSRVKEPTAPTKEGYKFVGWTYNNKAYDFTEFAEDNMTLVAQWEKIEVHPSPTVTRPGSKPKNHPSPVVTHNGGGSNGGGGNGGSSHPSPIATRDGLTQVGDVQTGDESNVEFYLALLMVGITSLLTALLRRKA